MTHFTSMQSLLCLFALAHDLDADGPLLLLETVCLYDQDILEGALLHISLANWDALAGAQQHGDQMAMRIDGLRPPHVTPRLVSSLISRGTGTVI